MKTHHVRLTLAVLLSTSLLMIAAIPSGSAPWGPREENMTIYFYATQEAAYTALVTGNIDIVLSPLSPPEAEDAFANPDLVTCRVPAYDMYEFDLNNNYTIPTYPDVRSPMNYSELRKAIAFLTDKDYYVNTWMGGKAVRIDQMIAAPLYGWANLSMSYPYYPYEYSPAAARALLDSMFPVGTTPNPYYDPGDPFSSLYLRRHPQTGLDLDPLIFYRRLYGLWAASPNAELDLRDALRSMGVPVTMNNPGSGPPVNYTQVIGEGDYHLYTGRWNVGRFPPMTLYRLYHSANAAPYGTNYVTGNGTHPYLDQLLAAANYAASYWEASYYTQKAAGYMTQNCVNVPLWSTASYWAWSTKLQGVVNSVTEGPANKFTFMNAYKTDGSAIRCGTIIPPTSVNTVYSTWIHDYNVLDRMNLYGGVETSPYNSARDQVGFVDDFKTTTWIDGADEKTKVVMSFRENAYATRPVTGARGENINASHYFWNAWLDYQIGDGWWSPNFADLHHVVITGPYDFEIYFDTLSYWNLYYCQGPLRPMDTWMAQGPAFIGQAVETIAIDTVPVPDTPGPITLVNDPIWFNYVTFNGMPLTFMSDYNIVLGDLYIYPALGTGTLEVSYRYVPENALRGFLPGTLPWQTILEGAGMYYCTAFTPGLGGSITFRRAYLPGGSGYYYMVTPPLGEVDFVKKPDGNYKVDIFDLALVAGAYGSQGTAVPSANWFPGADLAPAGGVIDIYDLVTVTSLGWDKEYDPLNP